MALGSRIEQCFIGIDPSEIFVTRDIDACVSESETRSPKLERWASVS